MTRILAIAAALALSTATSFAGKKEKHPNSPEAQFAKLDSNSDGSLSLEEFKHFKKAHAAKAGAAKKAGKKAPKKAKKHAKHKDGAKAKKHKNKKAGKKHGKARKK